MKRRKDLVTGTTSLNYVVEYDPESLYAILLTQFLTFSVSFRSSYDIIKLISHIVIHKY